MPPLPKIILALCLLFVTLGGLSACGNCFAAGNQRDAGAKCDFIKTKF